MEHEFVSYEQALALKELGFDAQCLALYDLDGKITIEFVNWKNAIAHKRNYLIPAPLFQQAFRFLLTYLDNVFPDQAQSIEIFGDNSGNIPQLSEDSRGCNDLQDFTKKLIELCIKAKTLLL